MKSRSEPRTHGARAFPEPATSQQIQHTKPRENSLESRTKYENDAPNGDNDADQTPPEDDLPAENGVLGPVTGVAREGTVVGTGHEAEANTLEADIDLGWLPEPGRTQALSGRAAAYDDTGRCAYH